MVDVRSIMAEVGPATDKDFEGQLTRDKVLAREIPWEGYERASLISDRELELIRRFDKKAEAAKREIVEADPDTYSELFVTFVLKISNPETLQYVLTLINDLISSDPRKVDLFLRLSAKNPQYPYPAFIRLLPRWERDWYISKLTCTILARLLARDPSPSPEHVTATVHWLIEQLRKGNVLDVHVATSSLQILLQKDAFRPILVGEGGLPLLVGLLHQANLQVLYETIYSLWLLTYNQEVAAQVADSRLIPSVVETLKTVSKEKIVRLCLSTLRNLLDKPRNNEQMIDAGLMRMLNILSNKKWGDEDIIDDLKTLNESLAKNIVVMSSFDTYKKEILSGRLEWSPVHKSDRFWRENNGKLEDNDYQLLLMLKDILTSGGAGNPQNLAIACFDLGEFARYHPRGRVVLQRLDIKMEIMRLMTHENPEVKKEALYAIQKMMVHNWEYLSAK
eukprot:TRINITY_DN562_c0_g1_i1.p1 TRINITY_DN562_c0_g1~~TRINITY_DN562_c0_g1_i1.p1  ORF type:complete len:449 (+),score=156.41 TRINITY_DN562_c0_g1_i1:47-1393(+)